MNQTPSLFNEPTFAPATRVDPAAEAKRGPSIVVNNSPLKPSHVFDTYWRFATERQRIFFRRLRGQPAPWTEDEILLEHKFTNAYRASDRVSQYLIRDVIYTGEQAPEEVFFRTMLFKFFNRIETWQLLTREIGELRWCDYTFEAYDKVLTDAMERGEKIYSMAYIMPSANTFGHGRKHRNHLALLERMMADRLPQRLQACPNMAGAFELLLSYPSLGNFLAYQFVTDLNYSQMLDFSEMEFVIPGPGALDGIQKCFKSIGDWSEADVIRIVAESQDAEFERLGLNFPSLWGRPLQLIDCQNLFCEVDKYSRVAHPEVAGRTGRKRIKQHFKPIGKPVTYWYPPKWGINEQIVKSGTQAI
jgi:hypothetical protein